MPAAIAACTAQPGSVPCAQSRNRHPRGQLLDVLERLLEPFLGVPERELAHPGRVDQAAAAGEHDQLAVGGRVAAAAVGREAPPVASRSEPHRRFTSVDLPTPDEPTSVAVRPPARWATSSSMPSPVTAETTCTGTPKVTPPSCATAASMLVAQVGLGQHDDGLGAALPGERQVALQPARVRGRRRAT